jgi:hypothetical protein
MNEADAYNPPGLPLPTVAHDRGHGIRSLTVYCAAGLVCAHSKRFTFDELVLPDDMTMIHIPRHRRFVCSECGSRKVTIRSVWPERNASGPFYSPSMSGKNHE